MRNLIHWILTFILSVLVSCAHPGDEYIINHTNQIEYASSCEFEIEFRLEDPADIDVTNVSVDDLLLVSELVYESVFPRQETLRNVIIFIPGSFESWAAYRTNYKTATAPEQVEASHCNDTDLGYFLIVFNPIKWRELNTKHIVSIYIHELIHHVADRLTNSSDPTHSNAAFWGQLGLENAVLSLWVHERES